MATRLVHLTIDAADPVRIATFWAQALGWITVVQEAEEVVAQPAGFDYPGAMALPMPFVPVTEPKTAKNRVHRDLASTSLEDQAAQVDRLIELGATRIDLRQGEVPWVVLADPEGNEFCVLEPRPIYRDTGPVAAIVVDCVDPGAMSVFWAQAAGWPGVRSDEQVVALRTPSCAGPVLDLISSAEPKRVKNRAHIQIAPYPDDDQAAEAIRLQAAGARPADIGQGDEDWIGLADPESQQFCILSPR